MISLSTYKILEGGFDPFLEELKEQWDGEVIVKKRLSKIILELHTGGLSHNEEIIEELQKNMYVMMFHTKWEQGGHYYFSFPKDILKIDPKEVSLQKVPWHDYGESSLTIVSSMLEITKEHTDLPHDTWDFQRCVHLFHCLGMHPLSKKAKEILNKTAEQYHYWKPLVEQWPQLYAMWENRDPNTGHSYPLDEALYALRKHWRK